MSSIDLWEIKQEWVNFLRNSDIFTITQRGVTTTADTGTFTAATSHLIDITNGKNIRSIVVGGVTLSYGADYNVDFDFLDTTLKTKITFTVAQTGAYTITYDFGSSDKIFPDFPREDLTLASFPRIGADIMTTTSSLSDMDGVLLTSVNMTTIVYEENIEQLNRYITAIDNILRANKKNFYYIGKFVSKVAVGPVLKTPEEISLNKIFQQNIDTQGILNFER